MCEQKHIHFQSKLVISNAIPNYVQGKSLWLQVAMPGVPSTPAVGEQNGGNIAWKPLFCGQTNNMETKQNNWFNLT